MKIGQHKMANDDVDDVMLAAASFFYMYDSEDDVGDGESRRKRVCRPRRFWVHDVIRGREVSKVQVLLHVAAKEVISI